MSKKLTPTIARALAEKVRAELKARNADNSTAIVSKIEKSKDYKDLLKLNTQIHDLEIKKAELKKSIEEKHSSKIADVSISLYSYNNPSIYVREHASASVESIKDMILIEDYMSENTLTSEEFITMIVDKLSNS